LDYCRVGRGKEGNCQNLVFDAHLALWHKYHTPPDNLVIASVVWAIDVAPAQCTTERLGMVVDGVVGVVAASRIEVENPSTTTIFLSRVPVVT
jgi:hypothetical protein